jgi:3-methylcrotonyl-CoA carboxylase alpha subunit
VANNVEFLARLVACPAFASADLDTGLIERERGFLFPQAPEAPPEAYALAALAELLRERRLAARRAAASPDPHSPWHLLDGWRLNSSARRTLKFRSGELEQVVSVTYGAVAYRFAIGGRTLAAKGELLPDGGLRAELGGRRIHATVIGAGEKRHVFLDGRCHRLAAVDPLSHAAGAGSHDGGLTAPMPGKVIALLVPAGAEVKKGTPLLILEAMKMEHTLCAPGPGRVEAFRFRVGDQVAEGVELVDFAALEVVE